MADSKGVFNTRKFKALSAIVISGTILTQQYKYLRNNKPALVDKNIWAPFMKNVYPFLLKT